MLKIFWPAYFLHEKVDDLRNLMLCDFPHFERFQDSQIKTSDPRHVIDQKSNILSYLDLELLFSSN